MNKRTILLAAASLSAFTTSLLATDYTTTVKANSGQSVALQHGDTITTSGVAIRANGGEVTLDNFESAISITMDASSSAFAINAQNNGSVNLGTGSTITSNRNGLSVSSESTFTASNLSLTVNQPEGGGNINTILIADGSVVDLGTDSDILVQISDSASASDSIRGLNASNATFTATDGFTLRILAAEDSASSIIGVNAALNSEINLGTNALIEAQTALTSQTGSTITASNAVIRGTGNNGIGIRVGAGGNANLIDSTVSGTANALVVAASSSYAEPSGTITISGGSLHSESGSVILAQHNGEHANAVSSTVVLKDGASASSQNGVLFASEGNPTAESTFDLVITGKNTQAIGFEDGTSLLSHLTVSDQATWQSCGSSTIDTLTLNNANIDLALNSVGERINVEKLEVSGSNNVDIQLSNAFLLELLESGLPQLLDFSILAGEFDLNGSIVYNLSNGNADGSTWDITDLGNGQFLIDNIQVIPEPSQTAMLLGTAFILSFAWQRRRQQKKCAAQQQ